MSPVEQLEDIAGGTRRLADVLGVNASLLTRWKKWNGGHLPVKYNGKVREWAQGLGEIEASTALACLDPATCPTCGQPVPEGSVL